MKCDETWLSLNYVKLVMALCGFVFFCSPGIATPPPTFWTGPNTNFFHSGTSGLSDQLTPDVILTRGSRAAIYNSATEPGWNSGFTVPTGSPGGTEWAVLPGTFD